MQDTIERIRRFRDERNWLQFHNPKDLAMSVAIEAAELMELFQWQSAEESKRTLLERREAVADEIADVAIYLIELCDIAGIDLAKAIDAKLAKNALKYPSP
ncbi:MAG: nucleotide pyrophosphohydrolase [Betaproteobacteria bacterium]